MNLETIGDGVIPFLILCLSRQQEQLIIYKQVYKTHANNSEEKENPMFRGHGVYWLSVFGSARSGSNFCVKHGHHTSLNTNTDHYTG